MLELQLGITKGWKQSVEGWCGSEGLEGQQESSTASEGVVQALISVLRLSVGAWETHTARGVGRWSDGPFRPCASMSQPLT